MMAALVAAALAVPALAASGELGEIFGLSTAGQTVEPADVSEHDRYVIGRLGQPVEHGHVRAEAPVPLQGVAEVRLVATRDGRAFHSIAYKNGTRCYATGAAEGEFDGVRLGHAHCPPDAFPSRREPVLDMSFWKDGDPSRGFTVERLEGFAADPVAEVGLLAADGTVHARTLVVDNVYTRRDVPDGFFTGIAAFDADGRPIELGCQARVGQVCIRRIGDPPQRVAPRRP